MKYLSFLRVDLEQTAFLKTKLDLTQRKLEDCQQEKEIWISRFEELEQNAKKAEEKVLTYVLNVLGNFIMLIINYLLNQVGG